jgi:hypothetical protein
MKLKINNEKMDIELQSKLLRLKGILNSVSHVSFSYSRIEKEHPMMGLNNEQAKNIIKAYEQLLFDLKNLIMNNEQLSNK